MQTVELYTTEEQISTHFRASEFQCHDGSWPVLVHEELLYMLEEVRNHFNVPVTINSGYRTVAYNAQVGGSKTSYHTYGMAADIVVKGVKPEDVAQYVEEVYPNSKGIGRYKTFTHIDCRADKARWKG